MANKKSNTQHVAPRVTPTEANLEEVNRTIVSLDKLFGCKNSRDFRRLILMRQRIEDAMPASGPTNGRLGQAMKSLAISAAMKSLAQAIYAIPQSQAVEEDIPPLEDAVKNIMSQPEISAETRSALIQLGFEVIMLKERAVKADLGRVTGEILEQTPRGQIDDAVEDILRQSCGEGGEGAAA